MKRDVTKKSRRDDTTPKRKVYNKKFRRDDIILKLREMQPINPVEMTLLQKGKYTTKNSVGMTLF